MRDGNRHEKRPETLAHVIISATERKVNPGKRRTHSNVAQPPSAVMESDERENIAPQSMPALRLAGTQRTTANQNGQETDVAPQSTQRSWRGKAATGKHKKSATDFTDGHGKGAERTPKHVDTLRVSPCHPWLLLFLFVRGLSLVTSRQGFYRDDRGTTWSLHGCTRQPWHILAEVFHRNLCHGWPFDHAHGPELVEGLVQPCGPDT